MPSVRRATAFPAFPAFRVSKLGLGPFGASEMFLKGKFLASLKSPFLGHVDLSCFFFKMRNGYQEYGNKIAFLQVNGSGVGMI